ncbi:hypothetical protein [Natronorubrum bangense]|uniref:hypothetical protein n=1 Tax=Natronorubrum bangense TaxID=61858 RepID=UPI0010A44C35|nr:hypothetical protein [Natronorubrum bangense]
MKRQLIEHGGIPEPLIETETAIFRPHSSGWRRPDIKLFGYPHEFNGIAFEIKTETSKDARLSALRQLITYRLGNWHPVIVAEEDIYEGKLSGKINHRDIAIYIGASYVELISKSPPEFSIRVDRTPNSIGLPHPIGKDDFAEWCL